MTKVRTPVLVNIPYAKRRSPMTIEEIEIFKKAGGRFLVYDLNPSETVQEFEQESKSIFMKTDFIKNPVITGKWKPTFYWTGNLFEDAERINRPHIKQEGEQEDRIDTTLEILNDLKGFEEFTINDILNIQNLLLKQNNWRGIKSGFRDHNVSFSETPDFNKVKELTEQLFPVSVMDKDSLLEWYRQIQIIHPLSDLNGRVFGIIISILNESRISKSI